jgi:hypothetical protein
MCKLERDIDGEKYIDIGIHLVPHVFDKQANLIGPLP